MQKPIRTFYEPGTYYSPLVNTEEIKAEKSRVWPVQPHIPGIDFNESSHQNIIENILPAYQNDCRFPRTKKERLHSHHYYSENGQFPAADALLLHSFLRMLEPANVFEVGSGYSSLVTAAVNHQFFNNSIDFLCIEPYPIPEIQSSVPGLSKHLKAKIQEVPLDFYDHLGRNDILFIDTSHVCKTGSDVNHIYFDILPRLKSGVYVHIHDIFLPFDYPQKWVIDEGRGWNEQYLLQALLMFSKKFDVVYGNQFAQWKYTQLQKQHLGAVLQGGSSFWFQVR